MIELRWLRETWRPVDDLPGRLQYRFRLGGVSLSPAALDARRGALGLQIAADEGWSAWQDVPVVGELPPAPAALPAPESPGTDSSLEGEDDA